MLVIDIKCVEDSRSLNFLFASVVNVMFVDMCSVESLKYIYVECHLPALQFINCVEIRF